MLACILASWCILATLALPAAAAPPKGLSIYFIDTEGGAATLIVTPAGESVLHRLRQSRRPRRRAHSQDRPRGGPHRHRQFAHHALARRPLRWRRPFVRAHAHSQVLRSRHPEKTRRRSQNFPILIQAYKKASGGKSITLKAGDQVPFETGRGEPAGALAMPRPAAR